MNTSIDQATICLGTATLMGASIGFERQWRQRMAGLRTNTLVAIGAASFVVFAGLFPDEGSPTRVAAQVVSGIGFLGAGIIFREGLHLIETLAEPPYDGHADLPVLANSLQLDADEIFYLGESLQLLRFAQLSEGDLVLTEAGRRFAHFETDARKKLFAEHLMNYVQVMGLIRSVLDERPSHTAPAVRFRNELEDYMAEDHADETLKTIVSWVRYAELFAYDGQSGLFSLENPH